MNYTPEQDSYIKSVYHSSKGLASIAREQLRGLVVPLPSMPYIRQVWENAELVNHQEVKTIKKIGRKPLQIDQLDLIIDRIRMYGSLNAAAKKLKHAEESVIARLVELGLLEQVIDLEKRVKNP